MTCVFFVLKSLGLKFELNFAAQRLLIKQFFCGLMPMYRYFRGGGNPFEQVHGRLILEADEVWCQKLITVNAV
jgi:hypothetical protein